MSKLKYSTDDFISSAKSVHGNNYDYTYSNYLGTDAKVSILCLVHGIFEQTLYNHLRGGNCPKCAGNSRFITTEDFIKTATDKHSSKYTYSKSVYINNKSKLIITCDLHGDFMQTPSDHLGGKGCKLCANLTNSKRCVSNTNDFICKSIIVHNDKYIYNKVDYKGARIKVTLICKTHGIFEITPNDHLNGKGCSKCGKERMVLTKHLNGDCCHPCELPLYEQYRRDVWACTNENWKKYVNIINPHNLIRGKDYHLDHMYSIQRGFLDNIPPNIIGHYTNLQVITSTNNLTKNNKCSKILEQVYRDYDIANES